MQLLTASQRRSLPPIYGAQNDKDPLARVRLFTPWSPPCWTWYIIEFDGQNECFGLVDGFEVELGYFSLKELASITGPGGLRVERDRHFRPVRLSVLRAELETARGGEEVAS
jgi:hypothetical protein